MVAKDLERRLAVILCADIVGYSRLIGADEEGTLRRLRDVRAELIDPASHLQLLALFSSRFERICTVGVCSPSAEDVLWVY
jgi:hypothetical protein